MTASEFPWQCSSPCENCSRQLQYSYAIDIYSRNCSTNGGLFVLRSQFEGLCFMQTKYRTFQFNAEAKSCRPHCPRKSDQTLISSARVTLAAIGRWRHKPTMRLRRRLNRWVNRRGSLVAPAPGHWPSGLPRTDAPQSPSRPGRAEYPPKPDNRTLMLRCDVKECSWFFTWRCW